MPVQIPTINRFQPQAPQSVGRIQTNIADPTRPLAQTTGTLEKLAETQANRLVKAENDAADFESTKADYEFAKQYKTELVKAKQIQGDPTFAYQEFDKKAAEIEENILSQYANSPDYVVAQVKEKLFRRKLMLSDDRATSEALQRTRFDEETTKGLVTLEKENMFSAIEGIDAEGSNSLMKLRYAIGQIEKAYLDYGNRNGLLVTNEKGEQTILPSLRAQINVDISDGLQRVISVLNSTGKTKEANQIIEDYKDVLTSKVKADLLGATKESTITHDAISIARQSMNLPIEKRAEFIDKMAKSEQVWAKAGEYRDAFERRQNNEKERIQNEAYNKLATRAADLFQNGNSFLDLEKDPHFIALSYRLDQKQRDSLRDLFESPKRSNPNKLLAAYGKVFEGEMDTINDAEFLDMLKGLSESDKQKFWNERAEAKKQTYAEQKAMLRSMHVELKDQLRIMPGTKYKKDTYGKFKNEAETYELQFYEALKDRISRMPPSSNDALKQRQYIKDFLADYIKTGKFQPPVSQTESRSSKKIPTLDEKQKWVEQWTRENKKPFSISNPPKEYLDFIKGE